MMQRSVAGSSLVAFMWILLSSSVLAQQASGIAGVVRDGSGAVLPGVTVEAASPALIEKVRTVVTDGEGRYNVVDLRPGAYSVTFTLTGFRTVRREGVELPAGFTATVNAGMEVGALEETVVVTGGTPLVDTANVRQQKVLSHPFTAPGPDLFALFGVPEQPKRSFGARFHRIDQETADFILELKRDATGCACYNRRSFPEGLGDDQSETLAQRFLDDDVREALKRIDLDVAHAG